MRAYEHWLAPGGRLVAVMSQAFTYHQQRKAEAFRELVEQVGTWEHLPAGSFKESGTGVAAVIVVLEKP